MIRSDLTCPLTVDVDPVLRGRRTGSLVARALAVAACSAVLFAGACSSDSDSSDGAAAAESSTTTAADSNATTQGAGDETTSGDEDSSGFSSGTATLVDGVAPPERTITIGSDGTATPSSIDVGVGETFTIANDGAGLLGIEIGGGDSVTTPDGATSTFTIAEAGTYQVTDLINENVDATVVVG